MALYKNYCAVILQQSFEVIIKIWLNHQSKAMIIYFDMEKKLESDFWKCFMEITQSEFDEFKFNSVFTHTLNFKTWNFVCLFLRNFFKTQTQHFYHVKIDNQSLSIGCVLNYILVTSKLCCKIAANKLFCKICMKNCSLIACTRAHKHVV